MGEGVQLVNELAATITGERGFGECDSMNPVWQPCCDDFSSSTGRRGIGDRRSGRRVSRY